MPINKAHIYKSAVEELNKKCQELHMYNEQCVQRINKIKKIKRRRKRDVAILKARLDRFKDNWRAVSMKRQLAPHPKRKTEQKRGPKPKAKSLTAAHATLNGEELMKETYKTQQQQQEMHQLPMQFHQIHQGQTIETDWSELNEPEQHKAFGNMQREDNISAQKL